MKNNISEATRQTAASEVDILIKGYKVTSSEEPFKTGNNHLPHHVKDEDQIYPLHSLKIQHLAPPSLIL